MSSSDPRVALGRGVGPSALAPILRDRSIRLALGLAVAVAIPVAVLFYFQFRSLSDLGRSSAVVLKQLSKETADGTTKSVSDTLKQPFINALLRITQANAEPLNLPFIQNAFERSLATEMFVKRYYVWSDVTDQHRDDVLAIDRSSHDFIVNPPESALMVKRFRELAPEKRAISVFEATLDGRRTYFEAQLRFTFPSRDRLTSFVALAVDAEDLRASVVPALVKR